MAASYLVFDVESVPDADLLAEVKYRGMGLTPTRALALAEREAIKEHGSNFLPYTFQRPVAVALMWVDADFRCCGLTALPECRSPEEEQRYGNEEARRYGLVEQFWECVESQQPKLVSFNGRTFDLPLLELMAFRYGLPLRNHLTGKYGARYRFGDAHIDLQEFMTNCGASRLAGGLHLLSRLLSRDGKGDVSGEQVAELYRHGQLDVINAYCKHDVLETYAVFLRSRVMLGALQLADEAELIREAESCLSS